MDDYISREAVCKALNSEGYTKNMRVHKKVLNIPAADVVEVVRCGECRYRYNTYSGWFCSRGVFVNDAVPPDDWYCADGKCKDGGQDDV